MVVRTIKTNVNEADSLLNNKISFIFRSDKDCIKEGDIIQFLCMRDRRSVLHRINNKSFVVTRVMDSMTAPLLKGYQVIGIRQMV